MHIKPKQMKMPKVSLVIIDTDIYNLSFRALTESTTKFDFDDVLIFSDNQDDWPGFKIIPIPKIKSFFQYNNLVINQLVKHLKNDYFILIQYDGFIIDKSQFSDEFFKYDYIGAPWPWHKVNNIGNGGFSWRSKKLMEAVSSLGYSEHNGEPEDDFICRTNRDVLEEKFKCRFAPHAVASQFSIEHGLPTSSTFGFHGVWHLVRIYKDDIDTLLNNLPIRILKSNPHFNFIYQEMKVYAPEKVKTLVNLRKKNYGFLNPKKYFYFKRYY
jgi:hypothetical protein